MMVQKEQSELSIFKVVLMHCIYIIAFPVIAFFLSKFLLSNGIFGLSAVASNVYAAGIAILVLHVALGAFIYKAYTDSSGSTKPQSKAD
ncbi:vacuolar ATPase assembly integral membrane protein VMA21 homolog [Trichogramma pretiosum]|uniref:Vacuolar ATPase assembly integral membrane protein VMA21 homolog n=1 Tax=Trichogramma kaykai TaxID=54128 RepID=A0ABD2W8Q9_9HYME|nr:vacuolar ATPase assembly integral membrane protein VMA21 homolog [Trichogramma pretiosum]XP_014235028.1 vacuolar ATPase assembly integral membrane protein VMA21 homolog [Trichogramma pretiosum]XP_023316602.1 vacuolar ATPase assembly integral membrane protein VMA21 homolog [Trichogramma pretiosum]XP_023316603.1 vacuolar ATPase assembly integral membrane protein VMA21 homolog [Trichogramma pretiosum]XP_023316604.1 vacuolar ATPase assembly integral membrane protein VMA21 homolog [Trichogramma p